MFHRFNIFIILFTLLCFSCAHNNVSHSVELPKIECLEQSNRGEISIIVNKQNNASFRSSMTLNQRFYTQNSDYLYVTSIDGENIDDLKFTSQPYNCSLTITPILGYFQFNVSASSNWESKNIVRVVKSITYSIYVTEIVSPVNIKIYEGFDSCDLINSCPI